MKNKLHKILIIAGSDPSGGAGIQADIKTATKHKVYASAAITCLTAQNTKKVIAINYLASDFLSSQIEAVLDDISFDAIKIGMLGNAEIIETVATILFKRCKKIPLVLDTVMVATSGDLLLKNDALNALKSKLISNAYIITPNIDEAEILAETEIKNLDDMKHAAFKIKALGPKNVLIKGGHLNFSDGKIHSILLDDKKIFHQITNKKVPGKIIHGTGCTLATAIACNLAKGIELPKAVRTANSYVYRAITKSLKVGKGSLVLQHF